MKNSNIHCLTLMVMIVMVYAKPLTTPDKRHDNLFLRQIHDEAEKMRKESKWTQQVPRVSHNLTDCVENFFCLAEKALNGLGDIKLVKLLKLYNKEMNDTTCDLRENSTVHIKKLLGQIAKCSNPGKKE